MNTLALSSLIVAGLSTLPVMANVNKDNTCDMQLHGNIQYQHGQLNIVTQKGESVRISPDKSLYINGSKIVLSKDEQQWVDDYYGNIKNAIPMTISIATEGLHIASYAVTEVFSEILGTDNEMIAEFDEFFANVQTDLNTRFYATDGSVQFSSEGLTGANWLENSWEPEFEARVEQLAEKSMGYILMAIGRQMLFEQSDMEDFATRMEHLGDTVEQKVEYRANELETQANALCSVLAKADYAETRMQQHIAGLSSLDVLEISDDYKMAK